MVFSGVLNKCGSVFPTWKARYFILDSNRLTYFESEGGEQKGQYIITTDTKVRIASSFVQNNVFCLENSSRTLYLSAENEVDVRNWVTAFEDAIRNCM